jgi:hypothetical protein
LIVPETASKFRRMASALLLPPPPPHYFVFTDEAGTSANEPVVIVIALVASASRQAPAAVNLVQSLIQTVPAPLRPGFVSHATDIQNDHEIRVLWPGKDRFEFLRNMMSIPNRVGMGLAYALSTRDRVFTVRPGYTREQMLHASAFGLCMGMADKWLREDCEPNATAQIIAEDIPEMRRDLARAYSVLRANPQMVPPESVLRGHSIDGVDATKVGLEFRIGRISGPVAFAKKDQVILLQVADAVAYGLRRYFSGLSSGRDYLRAICGGVDLDAGRPNPNEDGCGLLGPPPRPRAG